MAPALLLPLTLALEWKLSKPLRLPSETCVLLDHRTLQGLRHSLPVRDVQTGAVSANGLARVRGS